jgi:hypothetical protein
MKLDVDLKVFNGAEGFHLWEAVLWADVVVIQRPYTDQMVSVATVVKELGRPLVVDWDDDLSCVPDWNPHIESFANALPNLIKLSQMADVVTPSSTAIQKKVISWGGKRVELVKNAIDDIFKTLPKLPRKDHIVWRGGASHQKDMDIAKDMLKAMSHKNTIIFLGDKPEWASELRQVKTVGILDYANYIMLLNQLAPKMMVLPLVDCPFNHARSDIGAQEAYLVGAEVWHNHIGEYKNLPTKGTPRWLSETNAQRMQILESLV